VTQVKTTALAVLVVLSALALPAPAPAQGFALRDGDRVVFYGDSITQNGLYARVVEMFVATRFPEWTVAFYNSGVGGDKVTGGWAGDIETRLKRDVIAHKPTVVTIMLGMNDAAYRPYDTALFDAYATGYRRIVARLKEALPGVRVTLIQPSAYDDVTRGTGFPGGYNSVLRRYGAFVQELGREAEATVVDLNTPLVAGLETLNKSNPALARQLVPDRIHPGASGHLVMASALLRAWNAPSLVTLVELETSAAGSRLVRAENTQVGGLSAKGPYMEWVQTDRALPLPLSYKDGETELAEMAGAGLEALDQQVLRITGLASGRYEVLIDGTTVGRFTAAELTAGVNLAREETSMYRQALPVRWNVDDRQEASLVQRRLLVASGGDPKLSDAAATLATLDEKAQQERRTLAKAAAHRYEVRRAYAFR
jgi:lysophospholipase L1-like esterase